MHGTTTTDGDVPAPRIRTPRNEVIHSLLAQMQRIQWWPPERIARNQLTEIRKLLHYAREQSPWYEERLAGVDLDELGFAAFSRLPILERAALQRQAERIHCRRSPPAHGPVEEMMTSGSTGRPVVVRSTGLVAAVWSAVTLRDHLWHRRVAGLSNAALRWRAQNDGMAPEGWRLPDWGPPHNQFYATGPGLLLNASSDIAAQVDWLRRHQPHYLITHPSNLRALVLEIARRDLRLTRLRQVRTVGEALQPELRPLVNEVLAVPLIDVYSSQEVGYIALQCPGGERYHVQAENLFVEVLDAAGEPCGEGQTGRVVVTSLRNYATPLVRYEIGDYAEVGAPCACGRGLPALRRVHGRVRNMLRLPDGRTHWPNLGFRDIMRVAPLRQFQVVQEALDRLHARLVVETPLTPDQEAAIVALLRKHLEFPYQITVSCHDRLPVGANGKFEDFMSLLERE